jgi:hypothetical protein
MQNVVLHHPCFLLSSGPWIGLRNGLPSLFVAGLMLNHLACSSGGKSLICFVMHGPVSGWDGREYSARDTVPLVLVMNLDM